MKKVFTIMMCLAVAGLWSCGSKSDDGGIVLKAHAQYSTDIDGINTVPDEGAKVYLYYDVDYRTDGYKYKLGGTYTVGNNTLSADQTGVAGADGYVTLPQKFPNRKLTVVVESAHYPGQYTEHFYPIFNEYIIVPDIFSPK